MLVVCRIHGYGQSIVGSTSVSEGMISTYTYSTSTTYEYPCWSVSKGTVTSTFRSGIAYTAVVHWDTKGVGGVTFSYNCVATNPTQTFGVTPLTTPPGGGGSGPIALASISVNISGCSTPPPSDGTMAISANACGPKTITFTSSGDEPIGIERYWQTSPTGTSLRNKALTYVATASGTYYLRDLLGSCWGSSIPVSVTIVDSTPTPDAPAVSTQTCGPKILTKGTPPSGVSWYWQGTNSLGTDNTSATATSSTYAVSANGTSTVYLRAQSSNGCWSEVSRAITVTADNPPTPNSRTFDYCQWDTFYLSSTGESYNFVWYNANQQVVNTGTAYIPKNLQVGTYQYAIRIKSFQDCLSQTPGTVTVNVKACDDGMNTVETTQYTVAADGSPLAIGSGKVYGDAFGNAVQSQVKSYTSGQVLATQTLTGWYGKAVGSTLPAPINDTNFGYRHRFVTDVHGDRYTANNFDKPDDTGSSGVVSIPDRVFSAGPGTLGWYYSSDNSLEPLTPVTGYPYGRTWSEPGPNSKITKSTVPGDRFRMGVAPAETKKQPFKRSELAHYYALQPNFTLTTVGPEPNLIPAVTDGSTTLGFAQNGAATLATVVQNGETYVRVTAGHNGTPGAWPIGGTLSVTPGVKYRLRVKGYRVQPQRPVCLFIRSGTSESNLLWPGVQLPLGAENEAWVENVFTISAAITKIRVGVLFNQSQAGDVFYINAITFTPVSGSDSQAGYQYISHSAETSNKTATFVDADGRTLATARITATNTSTTPNTYTYDQWQYMYYNDLGQLVATVAPNGVNTASTAMPGFVTKYRYDHFGRTIEVSSPDEGTSRFVYSTDGKLRFSQNQVQREASPQRFSYTNYDSLGRVIEAGEYTARTDVPGTPFVFETLSSSAPVANSVLLIADNIGFTGLYSKVTDGTTARYTEATLMEYDVPSSTFTSDASHAAQQNVDGRLSGVSNENGTTWYSYDEFGQLTWAIQSITGFAPRTIDYVYDFTGNTTQVAYQKGASDAFYHHYVYDADQRLSEVWTSLDGTTKTKQATYQYYLHGPLKRTELTVVKQGIDYIYTANGALKGINHVESTLDPGQDGLTGNHASNKPDVFGMTLWYGDEDYAGAGGLGARTALVPPTTDTFLPHGGELPTAMLYRSPADRDKMHVYGYRYDTNRWLTDAQWGDVNISNQPINDIDADKFYVPTLSEEQRESVPSYDKNGNIQSLIRKGNTGQVTANYNYVYEPGKNQLDKVNHNGALFTDYTYNSIGQMIQMTEGTKTYKLTYTAAGKVKEIRDASDVLVLQYAYDASGQLLKKTGYNSGTPSKSTYYVHDPSGNVMAIYEQPLPGTTILLAEQPLYGASRFGVYKGNGKSFYEVTDHLGNVRAVIGTPIVETETATMESELAEEPPFNNIAATRVPFVTANHTGTIANVNSNEVVRLNNAKPAGPTRSLAVSPGDKIDLDVWAYYETGDYSGSLSDAILLNAVASAFGGIAGGTGETGQIFDHVNAGFTGAFQGGTSSSLPAAFLTYVVYDKNYNRLFWGSQPVTPAGNGAKEHLVQPTITIDQPGYIYICLYNRSATSMPVYFDDLTVKITHSEVVAGSDYYPFGMAMDGTEITDEKYRYGYQGQFSKKDSVMGWSEFDLRMYDPRIGRWLSPDPYGQFTSPYIGMGNIPNMNTDPDGGSTGPLFAGVGAFKYAGAIEAIADEVAIYSAMKAGITIFKPITVTPNAIRSFAQDAGWVAQDMGRYAVNGWGRDLGKLFTGMSTKVASINHGWVGTNPGWVGGEYDATGVTIGRAFGTAQTMMTMNPGGGISGSPIRGLATTNGNLPITTPIVLPVTTVLDVHGRVNADKGDFRKASDKELNENGIDAHELKYEHLGSSSQVSRFDLFINKETNEIWIFGKGLTGDGIETGVFVE